MMTERKIRVNISVTPEFWAKWKEFAQFTGLSASELVEMAGTAMIDGSKNLMPLVDYVKKFEAEHAKKGRKK